MNEETLPTNEAPESEPVLEPQPEAAPVEEIAEEVEAESMEVTPEPVAEPEAPPQEPGRTQVFFKKLLRWSVLVSLFFLAGLLSAYFFLYKPVAQNLAETQDRLADAVQQAEELKSRLTAAETTVTGLKSENETLQAELDEANDHLSLIQVLVDVSTARLALVFEDVPGAKLALTDTPAHLERLSARIAEYDANLASSMPQRLSLILSGLESDPKTAEIDLELLTKNLLDVEKALFGGE